MAEMRNDILVELLPRIKADFKFKKTVGGWLQGGECPKCNKKELFAKADNPWTLNCGRKDNCGHIVYVKEEYPDIFDDWSKRYAQSPAEPNAAADAYLRTNRGFDLARIQGCYTQEYYQDRKKGIGSATVRFPIANGGYWERLIDQPGRFEKKANFNFGAQYQGTVWEPPMQQPDDEIWFVEGIFDSIALLHAERYAATPLSCNNYPYLFLQAIAERCIQSGKKRPKLVFAYDDGKAGRDYMKRHVARAQAEGWEASAAYIRFERGVKRDWSDLHLAGGITDEAIEDARYRGALLTARSAADKAGIIFKKKQWRDFYFDFNNRLYWFEIDYKKLSDAEEYLKKEAGNAQKTPEEIKRMALEQSRTVFEIANCLPTPLYYQSSALTDEAWYYVRIDFPHDGNSLKAAFNGRQIRVAGEFSNRLIHVAPGALYTGNQRHLDLWLKSQMFGIRTVDSIDFIGYSKDHKAWIFDKLAVAEGKVIKLNEEDFFDIGKRAVNSRNKTVNLAINADLTEYDPAWSKVLWSCFGAKGFVALSYWLGSLFAEQIREPAFHESYPFLEVTGEPNAGKSTLIEFFWKLCGRTAYEGFDPAKSSAAGRSRNLVQVSNLPIVLIESDRDKGESDKLKQRSFDWDEFKTAFNGRSVRSLGVKSSGTDTYEPPFRGALVISQNAKVVASDAFMQRIVHIWLEAKPVTVQSRAHFKALTGFPVKACSGFVLKATRAESEILKTVQQRYEAYVQLLDDRPEIRQQRVKHNHAQLMALVDALRLIVEFDDDMHLAILEEIIAMAIERQETINDDPPVVQEFWEVFDYIESRNDESTLNHSRDDRQIAVSLNEFVSRAESMRQQVPDMREVKKHLRNSRWRRFVKANHPVNSRITNKTVKCWVFERDDPRRKAGDD